MFGPGAAEKANELARSYWLMLLSEMSVQKRLLCWKGESSVTILLSGEY
jgi:hypothetical protein